jgi:formate/nitrite transporter FocA (FNT family)
MMMKRLWLAVVLGGILGLGITVVPGSIAPEQKTNVQPATLASQLAAGRSISHSFQFQSILWGLVAGVIVAFPVFMLVRRRL